MSTIPPPPPPPPPHPRQAAPRSDQPDALEQINRVADTIAGPNLRLKDNVMQAMACAAGVVLGAIAGAVLSSMYGFELPMALILGAIGGLVVGLFGSGIVLMVLGFVRAAKRTS
jgi:uncharacterized membrane protein YeaQ/YmgE (transglycosylase-associated protein family)